MCRVGAYIVESKFKDFTKQQYTRNINFLNSSKPLILHYE
jgi:hypothetical protein